MGYIHRTLSHVGQSLGFFFIIQVFFYHPVKNEIWPRRSFDGRAARSRSRGFESDACWSCSYCRSRRIIRGARKQSSGSTSESRGAQSETGLLRKLVDHLFGLDFWGTTLLVRP